MPKVSAPQSPEKYRIAVALLECACKLPKPVRTVAAVIQRFMLDYADRGEKCPVSDWTLRNWADHGIKVPGVPEAGRPYLEIAAEVDEGGDILERLGAGEGVSSGLRMRVLDDGLKFTRDMLKTDEYKAHVKDKPESHTALLGKLTDAAKLSAGGGDLDVMLDRLSQDEAEVVLELLFKKWPALMVKIRKAVMG